MLNNKIVETIDAVKEIDFDSLNKSYDNILAKAIYNYGKGNVSEAELYGQLLTGFDCDNYGNHWILKTTNNNEDMVALSSNIFDYDKIRLGLLDDSLKVEFKEYIDKLLSVNSDLPTHENKIAICITGQLRGFEKVKVSIQNNVIEKNNSDVFFSVWDTIGGRSTRFMHAADSNIKKVINKFDVNNIENLFPEYKDLLDLKFGRNIDYIKNELNDFNGANINIYNEQEFEPLHSVDSYNRIELNQEKLYYTMLKSVERLIAKERQQGYKYKHIIKLRPDKAIVDNVDFDKIRKNRLGVNNNEFFGPGDQTIIGHRDDMILCLSFYDFYLNHQKCYSSIINSRGRIAPHNSIGKFLWAAGLDFERYSSNHPNGPLKNLDLTKDEIYKLPIFSYFDKILNPKQKEAFVRKAAVYNDEVETLIKAAKIMENHDIACSLAIMKKALVMRPNGIFIKKKIDLYQQSLNTKSQS